MIRNLAIAIAIALLSLNIACRPNLAVDTSGTTAVAEQVKKARDPRAEFCSIEKDPTSGGETPQGRILLAYKQEKGWGAEPFCNGVSQLTLSGVPTGFEPVLVGVFDGKTFNTVFPQGTDANGDLIFEVAGVNYGKLQFVCSNCNSLPSNTRVTASSEAGPSQENLF